MSSHRTGLLLATGIALPFVMLGLGPVPAHAMGPHNHAEILDAIWQVESSGRMNPPDGDGGRSIGPYQIQRVYWQDALARSPEVGGTYEDVRQMEYAEKVIRAYMQRYAREAWERRDAETIARIHNGGPKGASKETTLKYWRKVEAILAGHPDSGRGANEGLSAR